jgi:hypothetical protein
MLYTFQALNYTNLLSRPKSQFLLIELVLKFEKPFLEYFCMEDVVSKLSNLIIPCGMISKLVIRKHETHVL